MTTFYIVRHGESEGNASFKQGVYLEKTQYGSDLTEVGKKQSQEVAIKLKDLPIKAVYSSHLRRAQRTAEIIASEFNLPVHINEYLQERVKGKLGGKTQEEIVKEYPFVFGDPDTLSHDEMLSWKLFDDMETVREAVGRFKNELFVLTKEYPGQSIVVVTHGNVMRSLLTDLGFGSFQQLSSGSVKNGAFVKVETDGKSYVIQETVGVSLALRFSK